MIEANCRQCGYRFGVSEEARGLTAECPHCAAEVMVPSQAGEVLPLDQTAPPPVRQHTVTAEPLEVAPAPPVADTAEADKDLWDQLTVRARFPNAITPPKRPFAAEAASSPRAVFGGANRHLVWRVLLASAIFMGNVLLLMYILHGGGDGLYVAQMFGVLMVFVISFFPVAWLSSAGLKLCLAACAGDDETPVHVLGEGVWEDLVKPLGRMLATAVAAMWPTWLYLLAAMLGIRMPPWTAWASLALSLFFFPAAALLVVLGDSAWALSPVNVLRLIFGAPAPYLSVWAALSVVTMFCMLALGLANAALRESSAAALAVIYVAVVLLMASFLVGMRLIGLIYRHYKAKLPFGAE
jgi:hypothetical protein